MNRVVFPILFCYKLILVIRQWFILFNYLQFLKCSCIFGAFYFHSFVCSCFWIYHVRRCYCELILQLHVYEIFKKTLLYMDISPISSICLSAASSLLPYRFSRLHLSLLLLFLLKIYLKLVSLNRCTEICFYHLNLALFLRYKGLLATFLAFILFFILFLSF